MAQPTVRLNFAPLRDVRRAIEMGGPHILAAQRQWAVRYMGFTRRRFTRLSRGGADQQGERWPPLAASTVRRRRKGGRRRGGVNRPALDARRTGGSNAAILRDTNTLFTSLEVGRPDSLLENISKGVRVGLRGRMGRIAGYHQEGGQRGNWRLPQRRILVEPDPQTMRGMKSDLVGALQRTIADASRKLGPRPPGT